MDFNKLKIAVVYDWIDRWGGVERVLIAIHKIIPQACFYSSVYNEKEAAWAKNLNIKTSFIQRLPRIIRNSRIASTFLYPFAFEQFDFSGFNLVLSVTSSFSKSIITKPGIPHICYLLTPSRYLWLYHHPLRAKSLLPLYNAYESYLRRWDMHASTRPDKIISISKTVAERCFRIYGRKSDVIYPPFDTEFWKKLSPGVPDTSKPFLNGDPFYLAVSRLEPYKRIDIVLETMKSFPRTKTIIVGKGSLLARLRKASPQNILFIERVSDTELKWLYTHAKALIMPQEEDFGYVSLEAQYHGLPVIAFGKGGAVETVIGNKTGMFFSHQTASSLGRTLERFDKISYNLRHSAKELGPLQGDKYSTEFFGEKMLSEIINSVQTVKKYGYHKDV
jgi:glycosyltransferase involved in cell wall biosynthesis